MRFLLKTIIKRNIKIRIKKQKPILRYIIRPYRVQEAGKLEKDPWSYHREPISIFVSNSNEKFTHGYMINKKMTFLFVCFYHCQGRQENKLHSFVYLFQAFNPNSVEYLRFINCYGKANKKRISWHGETWLDIDYLLESQ